MNGFSNDNYIIDQDYFGEYLYRTIKSSRNGCGWIAMYNLKHYLFKENDFDSIRKEMDAMHKIKMPGPTKMSVMRKYFKKYIPNFKEFHGKSQVIEQAKKSEAGIFRYYEEKIPHFVTFVKQNDGLYRFFNVKDGLEDFCTTIDDFASKHFTMGTFFVFVV